MTRSLMHLLSGTVGRAVVSAHAIAACVLALAGYRPTLIETVGLIVVWPAVTFVAFLPLAMLAALLGATDPEPVPGTVPAPDDHPDAQ